MSLRSTTDHTLPVCWACPRQEDVRPCSCGYRYYCGVEHYILDNDIHMRVCCDIKYMRKRLRKLSPTPELRTASDYMAIKRHIQTRIRLAKLLIDVPVSSRQGVREEALGHIRAALAVNDPVLRDMDRERRRVPILLLRLNREQEAYDFYKWRWAPTLANYIATGTLTQGRPGPLDGGPADVLERVEVLTGNGHAARPGAVRLGSAVVRWLYDLHHARGGRRTDAGGVALERLSPLALVKVRVFLDLRDRQSARVSELMAALKRQIRDLVRALWLIGGHFFDNVLAPGSGRPPWMIRPDEEEMQSHDLWAESPAAIAIVRRLYIAMEEEEQAKKTRREEISRGQYGIMEDTARVDSLEASDGDFMF